MKKRSLVTAVAMLIVSAVVLTSATYAWFASNADITAPTFSATVKNNNGGILISDVQGNWRTTVTDVEIKNSDTAHLIVENFIPVSGNVGEDAVSFTAGSLEGSAFTCSGGAADGYIKYTIFGKAQVNGTVTVAPGFSTNSEFVYGAVFVTKPDSTTEKVVMAQGTDSYLPVISDGKATDKNGNSIIDAEGEAVGVGAVELGDTVSAVAYTAASDITFDVEGGKTFSVTVYAWAEGQDANCSGSVSPKLTTCNMQFGFEPKAESTGA